MGGTGTRTDRKDQWNKMGSPTAYPGILSMRKMPFQVGRETGAYSTDSSETMCYLGGKNEVKVVFFLSRIRGEKKLHLKSSPR